MANPSKVSATVSKIVPYGEGVYLVEFTLPERYTRFVPGQFLHLTLESYDPTQGYWPESRVFSIASAPRQSHVTVVYSVKGAYTRRMEAELAVGRTVWLKLPYGDFSIRLDQLGNRPVVLLAGGTGVSPYLPFLLSSQGKTVEAPIHLYYGVRERSHQLFGPELSDLAAAAQWFHFHLLVEATHGRLNINRVAEDLGDTFQAAIFFISGPPAMIRSFRTELANRGIAPDNIKIDEWE